MVREMVGATWRRATKKKKHTEESPDIGMDLQFLLCKSNSPNTCSSLGEADNIICRQHNFILSSYGAT